MSRGSINVSRVQTGARSPALQRERAGRAAGAIRRRWALAVLSLAAGLFATTSAFAQTEGLIVDIASFTSDNWPQGEAVVAVLDSGASPVAGLTKEQFQVELNGEPVTIAEVSRGIDSTAGIAVVLTLDVSGSMQGEPLAEAKAAALRFLEGLAPQDEVAIVTFSETATMVLDFTRDRAATSAAISALRAGGATALYPATIESGRLAGTSESTRRAVVILSDGGLGRLVGGEGASRADALASAAPLGVPFFTIGIGQEIDRAFLEELANSTGGRLGVTLTPSGLSQLYTEVAELLRSQYILTLDGSAVDFDASRENTLSVSVTAGELTGSGERAFAAQAPARADEGGNSQMPLLLGAGAAVGIVVLGLLLFFLRRRGGEGGRAGSPRPSPDAPLGVVSSRAPPEMPRPLWRDEPVVPYQPSTETAGWLRVVSGPLTGETFPVAASPVSIGTGHRCLIRLESRPDGDEEMAPELGRVWVRDDQLMVHELGRLTSNGPVGGQWLFLHTGDSFTIGPCSFRFELDRAAFDKPKGQPQPGQPAGSAQTTMAQPAGSIAAPPEQPAPRPLVTLVRQPVETPEPPREAPNVLRDPGEPAAALEAPELPTNGSEAPEPRREVPSGLRDPGEPDAAFEAPEPPREVPNVLRDPVDAPAAAPEASEPPPAAPQAPEPPREAPNVLRDRPALVEPASDESPALPARASTEDGERPRPWSAPSLDGRHDGRDAMPEPFRSTRANSDESSSGVTPL